MLSLGELETYIRKGKVTESGLKKAGKKSLLEYCQLNDISLPPSKQTVPVLITAILETVKKAQKAATTKTRNVDADAATFDESKRQAEVSYSKIAFIGESCFGL